MGDKKKHKLLIVDDERMNIIALAQILTPQYEVIVAIDGGSAIEAARKHTPDLILLDVLMPGLDGFEVMRVLTDSAVTKDIPVIFITGLNNSMDEERGFFLGAVDYITKPFNNSVVRARVGTHLKMADYIHTIEKLCMMDMLTELPNRRAFDGRLSAEWERALKERKPISILMIDVDKFKDYNDTYGHPQGDQALRILAGVFQRSLRQETDLIARWGGEEFIAVLANTDLKSAVAAGGKICRNAEQAEILCENGERTIVTVSVGAASAVPEPEGSPGELISRADKALYAAKDRGRNRVSTGP